MVPAQAQLSFTVRHERLLRDHRGTLTADAAGISYQQVDPKGKKAPQKLARARWEYVDLQQVWVSQDKLVLVTYQDRKWLFGADREFEFYLPKGESFAALARLLEAKLDRRFVSALAGDPGAAFWEVPVRLMGPFQGSEGVLKAGATRIVYETKRRRQSRTWRLEDIVNASMQDPYQLTLTTHERSLTHYGAQKGFNFQLKQPLDERRFDALWKRLNARSGLELLRSAAATPQN
jgi:hypothetical protein